MADVAEHDGEEEGKCDDREQRRVDLPVARDAVRVNDLLEGSREQIQLEVGRRRLRRLRLRWLELPRRQLLQLVHRPQCLLDQRLVPRRHPHLPAEDRSLHLHQVQVVVETLLLDDIELVFLDFGAVGFNLGEGVQVLLHGLLGE